MKSVLKRMIAVIMAICTVAVWMIPGVAATIVNVDAVAVHQYTENGQAVEEYYGSLEEITTVATSGTIKLLKDAAAQTVILRPGVTLDLNGYTLTADMLAALRGAAVIDGVDCAGSGKLQVAKEKLVLAGDNAYGAIPVWNGVDGYVFTKVTFQQMAKKVGEGVAQYIFLPRFTNAAAAALMADGGLDNGIEIKVCLTWNNGQSQQLYTYSDDLVMKVFDGTNRWVFDLKVSGIAGIADMVASPVVVTDCSATATTAGVALVAG